MSYQCVGEKIPILCNQENFLLKANTYKLFQVCPDFQFFINPAVKEVQNSSDHSPIFCNFRSITINQSSKEVVRESSKPSWRGASSIDKENCKFLLEERLRSIAVPTQVTECRDPKCKDEEHLAACDWFATELLEGIQDSTEETLPKLKVGTKKDNQKTTPGFREQVQPSKDDAYFWHSVWKSAGRPVNTELHKIMKRTRSQFHKNFKQCKRTEEKIKKSKLLDACLNGHPSPCRAVQGLPV